MILYGHDHDYERFAPQTPEGTADPAQGIREFVVGTGGRSQRPFGVIQPNSEVRSTGTYGVLTLTLHPDSYDWPFVPEAGKTFTDFGTDQCHSTQPTPGPTPSPQPTPTPTSGPQPTASPTPTPSPTPAAGSGGNNGINDGITNAGNTHSSNDVIPNTTSHKPLPNTGGVPLVGIVASGLFFGCAGLLLLRSTIRRNR